VYERRRKIGEERKRVRVREKKRKEDRKAYVRAVHVYMYIRVYI